MAINKAKVAIGFMVAGVLTLILGTILTFVGPIIIDDQVAKVSRLYMLCFSNAVTAGGVFVDVLSDTLQHGRPARVLLCASLSKIHSSCLITPRVPFFILGI